MCVCACVCVCISHISIKRLILRNWLMWLWRLGCSKSVVWAWQAQNTIELMVQFQLKASRWRPRRADGADEVWSTLLENLSLAWGSWTFCSIQAFNCLNEAHWYYGGQSALLKVLQCKGCSHLKTYSKLTQNVNHQRWHILNAERKKSTKSLK